MPFDFYEAVKKHITPDLLLKTSTYLGEKEPGIKKALTGVLPVILSSIISKASGTAEDAREVLRNALQEHETGNLDQFVNIFRDGGNMLDKGILTAKIFLGDKMGGTITTIATYAGVKNFSVSTLFSMVSSIAMGVLGKKAKEENLDAENFSSFLGSQKNSILNLLPDNLRNIAGSLGMGHLRNGNGAKLSEMYSKTDHPERKRRNKWIASFALAVLLISIVLFFLVFNRNSNTHRSASAANKDTTNAVITPAKAGQIDTAPEKPQSIKVILPGGVELNAHKGGIEDRLVSFLQSDWKKIGEDSLKNLWFDFDNLNFNTGSAVITRESRVQIENLIAIAKAFPDARFKIGGYTDKTGDEVVNKKISGERASAVKGAFEQAGLKMQIIGAEGYGSDYAKYPADASETDRVKDRHVSISVRS